VNHACSSGAIQGRGNIGDDTSRLARAEATFSGEPLPQALAADLVHDIVQKAFGAARGVDGHDVWVTHPGNGASLGEESAGNCLVQGELWVDYLNRHPAIERSIGGEKNYSHSSTSELAL
jgi:hypothetical protein